MLNSKIVSVTADLIVHGIIAHGGENTKNNYGVVLHWSYDDRTVHTGVVLLD